MKVPDLSGITSLGFKWTPWTGAGTSGLLYLRSRAWPTTAAPHILRDLD